MSDETKVGIDLLKKLAKTVVGTVTEIENDFSDKKISTMEIIGLVDNAYSLVKQGLDWKNLLSQAKDVDTEEGTELLAYIVELGVLDEKAQEVLTHIVALAQKAEAAWSEDIQPIIAAIKK
jgi:hypothetical protein